MSKIYTNTNGNHKLPLMMQMVLILLLVVMLIGALTSRYESNTITTPSDFTIPSLLADTIPISSSTTSDVTVHVVATTNDDNANKNDHIDILHEKYRPETNEHQTQPMEIMENHTTHSKSPIATTTLQNTRSNITTVVTRNISNYKIFQIGFHKVGTTSLFTYFIKHKESRICGVHYGIIGCNRPINSTTKRGKIFTRYHQKRYMLPKNHCLGTVMCASFARLIDDNRLDVDYNRYINGVKNNNNNDLSENETVVSMRLGNVVVQTATDYPGLINNVGDGDNYKLLDFDKINIFRVLSDENVQYFGDFSWAPVCYQIPCYKSMVNYTHYVTTSDHHGFTPYSGLLDNYFGVKYNIFNNIKYFEIIDKQYPAPKYNIKFILNLRHFLHYLRSKVMWSHGSLLKQGMRSFNRCDMQPHGCHEFPLMKAAWKHRETDIINVTKLYEDDNRSKLSKMGYWIVNYFMIEWFEHNCRILKHFWIDSKTQNSNIDKNRLVVFDIEKESFKKLFHEFENYQGLNLQNVAKAEVQLKSNQSKMIFDDRHPATNTILVNLLSAIDRYHSIYPNHYELTVLNDSVCPTFFWYQDALLFGKLFKTVSVWHPSTWVNLHAKI